MRASRFSETRTHSVRVFLCPGKGGMPQRGMDAGVAMPREGRAVFCSCKNCISAILGGHMPPAGMDAGVGFRLYQLLNSRQKKPGGWAGLRYGAKMGIR